MKVRWGWRGSVNAVAVIQGERPVQKLKKRRRSNVVVSCNRENSLKQLVILFGLLESYDSIKDIKRKIK